MHEITAFVRSHPPFYLIKNDPLEFEKVKTTQAIEDFSKVWFLLDFVLFFRELTFLNLIERTWCLYATFRVHSPASAMIVVTHHISDVNTISFENEGWNWTPKFVQGDWPEIDCAITARDTVCRFLELANMSKWTCNPYMIKILTALAIFWTTAKIQC